MRKIARTIVLVVAGSLALNASGIAVAVRTKAAKNPTCASPQIVAPEGASATSEAAEGTSPAVRLVRYPRPDGPGEPWSQWGQGLVLPDGRFVSAMGDERGIDGNSYVFVYDPSTRKITRVDDVLGHVDHQKGEFGYGKVHGQMVPGSCGDAYFMTYWGTRKDLEYTDTYRGDVLFHFDPATSTIKSMGVPIPKHGTPSLASLGTGMIYGEAADVTPRDSKQHDTGVFWVYDTKTNQVVFRDDTTEHSLFRNILLDKKGRAYVAGENGRLLVYRPGADKLEDAGVKLPGGGSLRASTRPAPDGAVYGVTQSPDGEAPEMLFALDPDGTVRSLGEARGYTTSLALTADGSRFYYVPGAHGDSGEQGTPVIAVDTKTGDQRVVTKLDPLSKQTLGLSLAGSYDVALDTKRDRLFVGLNAGQTDKNPWGEVVLAIVDLGS
jgi:hypothetical protein